MIISLNGEFGFFYVYPCVFNDLADSLHKQTRVCRRGGRRRRRNFPPPLPCASTRVRVGEKEERGRKNKRTKKKERGKRLCASPRASLCDEILFVARERYADERKERRREENKGGKGKKKRRGHGGASPHDKINFYRERREGEKSIAIERASLSSLFFFFF